MYLRFKKQLLLTCMLMAFIVSGVFAQNITVGNVDPGPFAPGSTIAVPISINDASGCIQQNNTFNLYLSDASGNFAPGTLIGTYTGFYTTFVNGIIPAGTAPGNYKVEVVATNPAITSTISTAFTISAGTGVVAGAVSQVLNPTYPEVYGQCIGSSGSSFPFTASSTAGSSTTATFYNELTKTVEANNVAIPAAGYNFTANTGNYTVSVKAVNGGIVGTYDYVLINNVINTNIGSTGSLVVCLINGQGQLTINLDITSLTGLQFNYPGNIYTITWGDGTPPSVLTFCQIKSTNGQVSHIFTQPSCGNTVVFTASNTFCGNIGAAPSNTAKVVIPPTNKFLLPATGCAGTALSIPNQSDPGIDPNTCQPNTKNLYTWLLDGIIVAQNYTLGQPYILPATTPAGSHTITVRLQNGNGGCATPDVTQTICLQNPPVPVFTLPAGPFCLSGGPITPVNTSTIDNNCNTNNQYIWTVTGPGAVSYAGGTNANSMTPQFTFTVPGVYQVTLAITTASCGTVTTAPQTIVVNDVPAVTLSANTTVCASNLTLTFGPGAGITQSTLTGTAQAQANTYTWTITGGAYSFQAGTNANSQYPQILFTDLAAYTIQATEQNNCGTSTKTQTITFVQAPTVSAGPTQTICAINPVATLAGSVTGTVSSTQWLGGSGTFNPSRNVLTPTYTPSAAEIAAGKVTLTLQANTALPAPCNVVTSSVTINITPIDNVNSPPAAAICTGQALNYTITAASGGNNFTWTASVTSGTATGFAASGNGNVIKDVINNTSPTAVATVVYKITPQNNGCPGNVFTLTVTVNPVPQITAAAVASPICSIQPANITLTSNIPNTSYTWTSVASAGITGNSTQAVAVSTQSIQDVLTNNGNGVGTVTYTITPYNGTCPGTPQIAIIKIQPLPVQSNTGLDVETCATTTYTLQGNNPAPGTGLWTVTKGPAGVTFSDPTNPNAVVSGLIPGNLYQFQWTITAASTCPPSSNAVNILIDLPTIGGTTAGAATVCANSNGGQITLTGQQGNILRWESSVDNGATWQPIVNVSATQSYNNLSVTTQYRAIIQSAKCNPLPSSVTTITVNQPPVIANAGLDAETCATTAFTLQGNNPAPGTGLWTIVKGPAGATFSDPTNPNAVVSGLIPGNLYQFQWTITASATCPPSTSVVNIQIDLPTIGGTTAGAATVCANSNGGQITLTGQQGTILRWESSVDNGATWQAIANVSATQSYTNLTVTTQYRAIIQSAKCNPLSSSVTTITVNQPPVQSNAGLDAETCATTTYMLQGNNPAPGTGLWTIVKGPAGATFSDPTNPNAVLTGLIPGNLYQFQWTITASATCPPSSSVVNIQIDLPTIGGTTAGAATVCADGNSGQITLTGQQGNILRWESSIDNGATWQPIANISATQSYNNLTITTQYRAISQSAKCNPLPSSVTTIVVNQPPAQANAGPDQSICNQTSVVLNGNSPGALTGSWTQTAGPPATIVSPNSPNTQVTNLVKGNIYTFTWSINGLPPCAISTSSVNIKTAGDVNPSFTLDKTHGCGPTTVTFTNTSTPSLTGGFLWDFGDGTTSNSITPPPHTYAPSPDGKEVSYTITLSPLSNCDIKTPFTATISISPAVPLAIIDPTQTSACGGFALTVRNLSPGTNSLYDFYLKDASGNVVQHIQKTDKSDVTFQPVAPTKPTDYTVYLVVTDQCGTKNSSTPIIISAAPSTLVSLVQIKNNQQSVCLGEPIIFQNVSTGGDRFTYTIYDSNKNPITTIPGNIGELTYTPTAPGTYYVSITAGDNGCGDAPASGLEIFTVYPIPNPDFTYAQNADGNVVFTNTTPNAGTIPAASLSYSWKFGNGQILNTDYAPFTRLFTTEQSPYTVTLTATDPAGGCSASITKIINIVFTGNLFLPNAFTPGSSNSEINIFMAKGTQMKTWHLQVFNNFGELVWETTKLDANGSPAEGWDGTFKGVPAQQGVYVWQASATFVNGTEWKGMSYNHSQPRRVGVIHLIR